MYWDSEEVDELVRFPIEGSAQELGSPIDFVAKADLASGEIRSRRREELLAHGFDYAPIRPYNDREVFNVQTDEIEPIDSDQYVGYNEVILQCINILTEYPFVIVQGPDKATWRIITRADLNTRTAKEYLYTYFAETARAVSQIIESEYDVEEIQDVYDDVRGGRALERWQRAVDENVDLHPVEFMSMADLKEVVAATESLRDQLQFSSKTKCREAFDLIENFRNPVMHAYRTVISDDDDVVELAKSLEKASELTIHAGGDQPGLDIPE